MRRFAALEAGMDHSLLPAWVVEPDRFTIVWANELALELWVADSREELFSRRLLDGAPEAVRAQVDELIARARAGESIVGEWIFYPKGRKTAVLRKISPVIMPDERLGLLYQARPLDAVPEALERDIAMYRHSAVVAGLVAPDGRLLAQNPTARATFGERERWTQWFADAPQAEALLAAAVAGEDGEGLAQVVLASGERRWHTVSTKALRDPVSAELATLVEQVDVSAQVEAEDLASSRGRQVAALHATLAIVERQREEIVKLAAPLLEVGRRTLAVPIIGRLDAERLEALSEKLLARVAGRGVSRVILDLTGAFELDPEAAGTIEGLVKGVALLGAQTVLSGIRAESAHELARAGIELEVSGCHRSLAVALELDARELGGKGLRPTRPG